MHTLYYCTQDVLPTANWHAILDVTPDGNIVPDLVTPLFKQGQIIHSADVKRIRESFGSGFTGSFKSEDPFGHPYTRIISYVDNLECTECHRYYIPALNDTVSL